MPKYTVKDGAGTVAHNGNQYGPGDKIEMSEDEALKIAHALKDGGDIKAKAAKG